MLKDYIQYVFWNIYESNLYLSWYQWGRLWTGCDFKNQKDRRISYLQIWMAHKIFYVPIKMKIYRFEIQM
jgi:hypothetical protein